MKDIIALLCLLLTSFFCKAQQNQPNYPKGTVMVEHAPITGDSVIAVHAFTATLEDQSIILYVTVFHQRKGDEQIQQYTTPFDLPKGYFKGLIPTVAEKFKAIKDKMGLIVTQ